MKIACENMRFGANKIKRLRLYIGERPVHLGPLFAADHTGRLSYIAVQGIITKGARV
jgi:hypothetical protein